ncbi:MAG: TetR/AcrR family transcriptional regulator [Clostridia bacterium]|nr:TetR/AcrR family transcriptional regulator [Clostridia bacterium]
MREQAVKNIEKEFLEPSFKYLVKNGLENTSVRDLCKVMGISYGSLYYWFEGKDEIYISVIKYGTSKVATRLFGVAFERLQNPDFFCDTFLDEIDKCKSEFRLIMQATSSPVYGDRLRECAMDFKAIYNEHIEKLSKSTGCPVEEMTSIIYMLISILTDYVVWEDRESSQMLLNTICKHLKKYCAE